MNMTRKNFILSASAFAAVPNILNAAGPAKRVFKVALVGCGWRGAGTDDGVKGAADNIVEAAKHIGCEVRFTAFADFFVEKAKKQCRKWGVDEKYAFGGANGYKQALATDCDIVILATPPIFRARHMAAAVAAGKHMFVEKPIAPDPRGLRDFIAASEAAEAANLSLVSGTCKRYQRSVVQYLKPVRDGAIGRILAGRVYRCHGSHPFYMRIRQEGMSNAAYLCNAWYAFYEMGGDHFVDQAMHEQDLANWFIGRSPESAVGNGARWRRPIGDGFDEFFIDFDYGEGLHVSSMARHIDNAGDFRGTVLVGSEGEVFPTNYIKRYDGREVKLDLETAEKLHPDMLVAEHVELLQGILTGNFVRKWKHVADTTATCIMGTLACYSGQRITMKDILDPNPSPLMRKFDAPFTAADFEETEDIPLPPDGRSRFVPGLV